MLKLATVFSGIGAIEHALIKMGIEHEIVFACDNGGVDLWKRKTNEEKEFLKTQINSCSDYKEKKKFVDNLYDQTKKTNFVQQSYLANYDISKERFYQDVTFLDGTAYQGEVDLFVGGSPCQSFSVVGKRGGLEDTRGTLFYEYARLVKEMQPKVFIYENVKGVLSHDKGKTWEVMKNVFDDLNYTYYHQVLNAKDYGIPQSRNRIFVVGFKNNVTNFKFPEKKELNKFVKDFLENKVNEKYYLSPVAIASVSKEERLRKKYTQINGDVALCQKAQQQFNLQGDFIKESDGDITSNSRIRKLTPKECLRLMSFTDEFKQVVSDTQMYRQSGNSIVVDVLVEVMKEVLKVSDLGGIDNEFSS